MPVSDPNVPSHIHRVMKVMALLQPDTVVSPLGARASAEVLDDSVSVVVECGEVLDEVTLRSYCIGAAHMALGWVRSEAIAIGDSGMIVALHPGVPVKSVQDFIAYAKANPGKLNYSSSGTGAITHLATELMNVMAGVRTTHIPFKGTGPALTALLSREVDFLFGSMPATLPHINGNRLRGLAVTTKNRLASLPNMPPLSEAVSGYQAVITYGLIGPKGLRADALRRWNTELNKFIESRDMKERLAKDGIEPVGGAPSVFQEVIRRDVEQWKRVVKEARLSFTS